MIPSPSKFDSGPRFLKPLLEEFNQSVEVHDNTVQALSTDGEVTSLKIGRSAAISVDNPFQYILVTLQDQVFRGVEEVTALRHDWNDDAGWVESEDLVLIRADSMTGFHFAGTVVRAARINELGEMYMILQDGQASVNAEIEDDLPEGGFVDGTPVDIESDFDNMIQVVERYGGTTLEEDDDGNKIPKTLGCIWNDLKLQWEAWVEKCPT